MTKAAQFYDGTAWQQFGLTTADYTVDTGKIADNFICVKSSIDDMYLLCTKASDTALMSSGIKRKIICISKTGRKKILTLVGGIFRLNLGINNPFVLSRDESKLYIFYNDLVGSFRYVDISTNFTDGQSITLSGGIAVGDSTFFLSIYKDLYIWVAIDNTVKIYDYDTKAVLASKSIIIGGNNLTYPLSVVASSSNVLYLIGHFYGYKRIAKVIFNGLNTLSESLIADLDPDTDIYKQILLDRWGDLIIITNSGTASTLLKYTTAGVLVDTKNLANPSYNLAIDADGNYFFYTALKEYQINANTAQGQPFTSLGYETRGTGNTGFGSNSTGYQPSVYA